MLMREANHKLEWVEGLNNVGMQTLWKLIWSLECPNKAKHFIWKVCLNILPMKYQLRPRGVGQDDKCELCGNCETLGHALWGCKLAGEVWGKTRLKLPYLETMPTDFIDIV